MKSILKNSNGNAVSVNGKLLGAAEADTSIKDGLITREITSKYTYIETDKPIEEEETISL